MAEWKFVSEASGGQYVAVSGATVKLRLCADSLDLEPEVYKQNSCTYVTL